MLIRPATAADERQIEDIDGVIESSAYLHVEQSGEGLERLWRLQERPGRTRRIEPNRLDHEQLFAVRQVVRGVEDGLALVAEHDGAVVASLIAVERRDRGVLRILDARVDSDWRRQGLGLALVYQSVQAARDRGLRAVHAQTRTTNLPAARLLLKAGFDPAGLDLQRLSNHDLVKEAVTLFWYAALD